MSETTATSAAPTVQPVARVDDLHVTFPGRDGDVQALRGVSLEIERGEIVAIVGESGSGKTIFGLSLLGLLPGSPRPNVRGSVVVASTDMLGGSTRAERDARRRLLGAARERRPRAITSGGALLLPTARALRTRGTGMKSLLVARRTRGAPSCIRREDRSSSSSRARRLREIS